MDKKQISDLEKQIMSTVNEALNAVDFVNLKKDINNKTGDTINQAKLKFNEYNDKYKYLKAKKEVEKYISKNPSGSVSGPVFIVVGVCGLVTFGFPLWTVLLFNNMLTGLIGFEVVTGTLTLFTALSGVSLGKGIQIRRRVKRFKKYVRYIDNNSYLLIEDLARFVKQKDKFVIKDLEKMIQRGMFLEGHIDEEEKYFMINDEVYTDYLNLQKQQIEEYNKKIEEEVYVSERNELETTIQLGRNYIKQINDIKNELHRDEIAVKLEKLTHVSSQIISQVEKNSKKISEVNKFINHYLPVTIKLVNSYKELNKQVVQGDNIEKAKNEIIKSIDVINSAFENLLDDLFEDVVLDVSTDISVLKTLFKQEGLAEEDFKK